MRKGKSLKNNLMGFIFLVAILLAVAVIGWILSSNGDLPNNFYKELFTSFISGDIQTITSKLSENTLSILLITFLIMFIHNLFPVVPLYLVTWINTSLLGLQFGLGWSILTSVICSVCVFLSVRYAFQDWVLSKVNPKVLKKWNLKGFGTYWDLEYSLLLLQASLMGFQALVVSNFFLLPWQQHLGLPFYLSSIHLFRRDCYHKVLVNI
ncbi:hypothetical protein MOC86_25800 [Priestia endophytica]|nr:hypothetical protein [Priestia endophytica]MCY8235314.1 hypothetical protein [Priestia endophytica]